MRAALVTNRGLEGVAVEEISEVAGAEAKAEESAVVFDAKDDGLLKLCYLSQSASRIIALLGSKTVKSVDDIEGLVDSIGIRAFSEWLTAGKKFAVSCIRDGEHEFSSHEVEEAVGAKLFEKVESKVDLKNPDIVVLVHIAGGRCHMGIDLAGFDLSKREYRIMQHGAPVKGTVAYGLARLAGFTKEKVFLDPFAGMGTIPIEAAMFASKHPVRFFQKDDFAFRHLDRFKDFDFEKLFKSIDSQKSDEKISVYCVDPMLRDIKAAQKNAKAAGVNKLLSFSRIDTEWLDTKFDLKSVDCIVTAPPQPSKRVPEKKVKKIYEEFAYSAGEILKDDGVIIALFKNPDYFIEVIGKKDFVVDRTLTVFQGKDELKVIILHKKQSKKKV